MSDIKTLKALTRHQLCEQFVDKYWYSFCRVEPDTFEITQRFWTPALALWNIREPDELQNALEQGPWKDSELRRFYMQMGIWESF